MATATDRRDVLIVDDHEPTRRLVISVMPNYESTTRCRLLGAAAFLAKPVDRELVTTMLGVLLAPQRTRPQPGSELTSANGC